MLTETRFLELLRELLPADPPGVRIGVGDDAAVLDGGDDLVMAADMLLDGIDFEVATCGLRAAAVKAIRKNVSDLAAMGAAPRATLVSVGLPPGTDEAGARELLEALVGEADRQGCPVVGGDTKRSPGPLVLAVTAVGEMEGRAPVRRDGARTGDVLFVTGPLGGSGLGRHLAPPVRIAEGVALAERGLVRAMLDLSDGLSRDLPRVCAASGVGAVVEAPRVPLHDDARRAAALDGRDALAHALHDGEDFELLFAVPPDRVAELARVPGLGAGVQRVGRVVEAAEGVTIEDERGVRVPLEVGGFEHRFERRSGAGEDRGAAAGPAPDGPSGGER